MKDKMIVYGFGFVFLFFFLYSLLDQNLSVSFSERRTLAQKPVFTTSHFWDGSYFESWNSYLSDHFPFRDWFREKKTRVSSQIYRMKIHHNAYVTDEAIYELESSLSLESLTYFTNQLKKVESAYFSHRPVYYAIVPDKNYYFEGKIPKLDYEKLYREVRKQLPANFQEIDLRNSLNLESYYRTDLHWRQDALKDVVRKIQNEMGLSPSSFPTASKRYQPFYGSYYSKGGGMVSPDELVYLTSDTIRSTNVYDAEKKRNRSVYEEEDLTHVDSYDIYLGGATPLLVLENPESTSNRELLLFRDSFGSSLAPLLIDQYQKITMIDLRYMHPSLLKEYAIDFTSPNQDILFLYSVSIVNQSFTLK